MVDIRDPICTTTVVVSFPSVDYRWWKAVSFSYKVKARSSDSGDGYAMWHILGEM